MNASSSSEDEVFVGATTSVERRVRATRTRRQTETFTPNFRQRLRGPAGESGGGGGDVASEADRPSELSQAPPIGRLDFNDVRV